MENSPSLNTDESPSVCYQLVIGNWDIRREGGAQLYIAESLLNGLHDVTLNFNSADTINPPLC